MEYFRKFKCNCFYVDGRWVICKYMIVLFFIVSLEVVNKYIMMLNEVEEDY